MVAACKSAAFVVRDRDRDVVFARLIRVVHSRTRSGGPVTEVPLDRCDIPSGILRIRIEVHLDLASESVPRPRLDTGGGTAYESTRLCIDEYLHRFRLEQGPIALL